MRLLSRILLLLPLVLGLGLVNKANAQATSNCDQALGEAFLDVNNVRARILNNGGLFWRGSPHVYEVPKGGGSNAIFASGVWIGGQVDGQLRLAASTYGPWEFWAGPLDENGNAPVDCSVYDRVFKVSKADVEDYILTGSASPDLREWPTGLGAPTLDADGNPIVFDINEPLANRNDRVIDLAAGERPAILGDMTLWWVMNDRGNIHTRTDAAPIGLEVHGTAFAFNTAGDIGNTTFYKYNIYYKGDVPLQDTYIGIYSDPDLGNFDDDYVGSDTTLGLGYVYNSDNDDEGGEGYGAAPPAAGYDFFQGPIVPGVPGDSAISGGVWTQGVKNLKMTAFAYYNNGGGVRGDPGPGSDFYFNMQGRWKDGQQFTFGGNGRDFSDEPTGFIFSGDPATGQGWSEVNPDPITNSQPPIAAADRRFVMATGPFVMNPGDAQEIVFGLVWARGNDNLDSVTRLRQADALAQAAFDVNFELPQPPAAPQLTATELNGQVILEWQNSPLSNNFLESYSESDPFAPDDNKNYDFEGYRVYQFDDAADQTGRVIATYDVPNGVQRVIDGIPGEPTEVVATGSDNGVQTFHAISNLTNYTTYYFGIQAFAYNEPSFPKIFPSPITRIEVVPTKSEDVLSEEAIEAARLVNEPDIEADKAGVGEGLVWVDIVNPGKVTGDVYTVEFREAEFISKAAPAPVAEREGELEVDEQPIERQAISANKADTTVGITFDIKRNGTVVFDGESTGAPAPQREKLVVIDGLQWSIVGPPPGIKGFAVTENAAGPLDPWDMGAFAFNNNGFPRLDENGVVPVDPAINGDRPTRGVQQSTNNSAWGMHTGGGGRSEWNNDGGQSFVERSLRNGLEVIGSDDYDMHFSQACADAMDGVIAEGDCLGWRAFSDGALLEVPFELWNRGTTPEADDDYRMVPIVCEDACGAGTNALSYDLGLSDHAVSGGDNDPYTDWVYWYNPADDGANGGQVGYDDFFFGTGDVHDEIFARTVLVNWNGGATPPDSTMLEVGSGRYDAELPETGTNFRILTLKPSQPGDVFTVNTAGLGTRAMSQAEAADAVNSIGISPNPYKGASDYERSQLIPEVRFTNLPQVATIRVFTLNGTLIKTFEKNSAERTLTWDLTTDNRLPVASGVYLVHVETNAGTKVIKFGVIQKKVALNTF